MAIVFISHSSKDKELLARPLAVDLRSEGHEVWFDEWSIGPGESIVSKVHEGIQKCDYFLVILSKASIKSRWVAQELNVALVGEIETANTLVIPILLGSVPKKEIPTSLSDRRYVSFGPKNPKLYQQSLSLLLSALKDPGDIGRRLQPIFECPRCLKSDVSSFTDMHVPTFEVVQWLTGATTEWAYDEKQGVAKLWFAHEGQKSRCVRFKLDEEDRRQLTTEKSKTHLWTAISRNQDDKRILKFQYTSGRRRIVSLYFINYAIEHYLEAQLRELTNEWDLGKDSADK